MKRLIIRPCRMAMVMVLAASGTLTASADVDINSRFLFPDANFRDFVKQYDKNNDGYLSDAEIATVTNMNCSRKGIYNLNGIEFFSSLTSLDCSNNDLPCLSLRNPALKTLNCSNNQMIWIQLSFLVSDSKNLETINCSNNRLYSLDLSNCTALQTLDCTYNFLTSLKVSDCTKMTDLYCRHNQLTSIDVSKNTKLKSLDCRDNQLTSVDLSTNTELTYWNFFNNSRTVSAPYKEAGTGKYLLPIGNDASNPLYADGFNIDNASNWSNATVKEVDGKKMLAITDATQAVTYDYYTGFRYTGNATIVYTENVTFTLNIDTSQSKYYVDINEENFPDANFRAYVKTLAGGSDGVFTPEELAAIKTIQIGRKAISNLKGIEYFEALEELYATRIGVTSVDLSALTNLKVIHLGENKLDSLDLSKNTKLETLYCNDNASLTSLDMSGHASLTTLGCYNCGNLVSLNVSGCAALQTLDCHKSKLTSLDVSGCNELTYYDCSYNELTGEVDVNGKTKLTNLYCGHNQLTSIDLSGCTALTYLDCTYNSLTSIDLSGCTALQTLLCYSNQLTSLDVSGCTALQTLDCKKCQLTSIDFSGCNELTYYDCSYNQLTGKVDVNGKTKLTNLYCGYNQLTSIDVIGCTALTTLDCKNSQLTSLDVSQNTALTELRCYRNQLTSIDLSGCNELTYYDCSYNQLTGEVDVNGKTKLTNLYCGHNQLTSIDLSGCTALQTLDCTYNSLTSLNVSTNTALQTLLCYSNQLTSLDLSQNTALDNLECYKNSRTVPMYYYMENGNKVAVMPVGNVASNPLYADGFRLEKASNWTNASVTEGGVLVVADTTQAVTYTYNTGLAGKDVTFTLNKSAQDGVECLLINEENFPDANFRAYVSTLQGGDDGVFTDEELASITEVNCPNKKIASLKGVEHFKLLQNLICSSNPLTSLDVSNNKALVSLNANDCARTVPMYYYMENGNKVTAMLVGNDASNPLYADGFRLEKASNWTNAEVRTIDGKQVLVVTDATQPVTYTYNTGLAGKDVTFTLNKSAQDGGECLFINEENFPDANFRAYVSRLSGGGDGVFTPEELAAITEVKCPYRSIASLKGVEHFKLLQTLICNNNQLESLDLSQNTALTYLDCNTNQLTSLDLSQNAALTTLDCLVNQLTSLDLSNNKALTKLYCNYNQLTSLDVSQNTALTTLYCSSNPLTSLDLSNNKALVTLTVRNCARTVPMCYYMENGNKVTVMPVGNDASNPLYADGFRLEKARNWTNAEVRTIDGKQVLVVTDATQPVTYTYNTGLAGKNVTFTIRGGVDVNGDGKIDAADVSALINVVLGNIEGDSDVYDVNGDGVVDALDVSTLIGMICGNSN